MTPMRPVTEGMVRDQPKPAWFRRGWLLLVAIYLVDGLVWWATGADVVYGIVVSATVVGTFRNCPDGYTVGRRVTVASLVTAALVIGGVVLSATFSVGLPVGARLVQGASGIGAGALIAGLLHRRERAHQR